MDPSRVAELRAFVDACTKDSALLADPALAFFREYLLSLGADLPHAKARAGPKVTSMDDNDEDDDVEEADEDEMRTPEPDELDEEVVESNLELEGADDVVQPDHDDAPQKMGDPSVEVTEERRDASQEANGMAMEAMSEGKLEEAVEHLTKAILLNPTSAIM